MTANNYLVTLKPLGNYFFGGATTFNNKDRVTGKEQSNYLVRSRKYPQQTTLLGVLRYALLKQYGLLGKNRTLWDEKIGKQSFNGIHDGLDQTEVSSWGYINKISPLMLLSADSTYFIQGFDEGDQKIAPHQLNKVFKENKEMPFYNFSEYDPKESRAIAWKSENGKEQKENAIFKESFRVGIKKDYSGRSSTDAFYKQFFYRLEQDFKFGFYLNASKKIEPFSTVLHAGADQSLFHFEISTENTTDIFSDTEIDNSEAHKITLISDAYCDKAILKHCQAAITNSISFRYIKTTNETPNFNNKAKTVTQHSMVKGPESLNLLERGSVLYTNNTNEVTKILKAPKPYRNAGFNYFNATKI